MDKVSVIIASWNRKEDLQRTLKSLQKQEYKNVEIIVIDNGSTDGSVELVEKKFSFVHLHKNKENLGVSIAKNQGTLLSTGEFVHFLDSDIELTHPRVISNMVEILKEHPEIGALGGEAYKTETGVITKRKEITSNCETSTYIMETDDYELYPCGYIATCNCMMRKKDLQACGGFDTAIMYAGEDKEIGYKLKQMHLKSVVDSRCLVYHYVSDKGRKSVFYAFHKNRIRIFLKNYPLLLIPLLPLLDIYNAASPKKIQELKQNNKDITKWSTQEKTVQGASTVKKFFLVGYDYAFSLLRAYLYNFVFFSEIMYIRFKRPNYLKETRKRWL